MTFAARLEDVRRLGSDIDGLCDLAELALKEGEEDAALPHLMAAARQTAAPILWQWAALLWRALDEHGAALDAFAQAARLAPENAGIAHGRARVAFEAGLDAVSLFEAASRLGPPNGDVLIGLAGARWAAGKGDEAEAELDRILEQVPLWLQGHSQLAQLRALMGKKDVAASLERAIGQQGGKPALWRALFDLHVRREDYPALVVSIDRAGKAGIMAADLADYRVIAAIETGEGARADALLNALPPDGRHQLAIWEVRHLLRTGRPAAAEVLIDREIGAGGHRATAAWPYAALAWRMTGDPRLSWLVGDPAMVSVVDIAPLLPPLAEVAATLDRLHRTAGTYLDQSVRGGTQTDGPLLSRTDPTIRALRSAVVQAVGAHVRALPAPDPVHPLLSANRDRRIRFSGSWSVRLSGGGHHANHVHPQGWISSALYLALPDRAADEPADAGWLTLNEPQAALGLDLPATRIIEPRPGRLVLFPSWMWHGTRPFARGHRLTVAFDVARPY